MNVKEFCKQNQITEEQFYGKEKIGGSLYLSSLTNIPVGFNPTVGGSLYLDSLTSIPVGFNPTVGGSLILRSLTNIPVGFNPTVGGSLDLSSLTSIPVGFNLTVGGDLILRSLTNIPVGFNLTVGGDLILRSLTSIPVGFNPTVGGSLILSSLTNIPVGFNPTVGGDLILSSLTNIPVGFNPTVGGDLYGKITIPYTKLGENSVISWLGGKYIKVDGIFCEVISKRGLIYRVKFVNSEKKFYIVTDGERYSHGNTIKEARDSLMYKISNRDKTRYENMSIDTVLSLKDMIDCYRVITGACEFGVKDFIKNKTNNKPKKQYSINEIIQLTNDNFGHDTFKLFFMK